MIENATGLILRTRPLTETSLIVQWLTPELGRLDTVAKGARRLKSAFAGKLDLFYRADFSFARSRRSQLHSLCEVRVRDLQLALRRDLAYLQQAAYCAALIEQNTETETPLPGVFELMREFLEALTQRPAQPRTVFAFELKLLDQLGLRPDLGQARLSAGARDLITNLLECNWDEVARLQPGNSAVREMRHFLQGFLIYHLGRLGPARSAAIAQPVSPGPGAA